MSSRDAPRKGERTQVAILETAAAAFGERGYDAATLEDVAAVLGLTRSAVLHHFGSKQEILHAIVKPFFDLLDAVLDRAAAAAPLSRRATRRFLTEFVDVLCDNRNASVLISRDITAQAHLSVDLRLVDRVERFFTVLAGPEPDRQARLRAMIALGGIVRPVATPPRLLPLDTPADRQSLVDCALHSLRP